jgi:hypothetical protein
MKSIVLSLIWVFALSLAQASYAQAPLANSQPDGLSVGSYPYFVALSKRCGASTPEKEAALMGLRKQSIELARSMIPMLAASVKPGGLSQAQFKETKSKLATMDKNWPEASDLAAFDKTFEKNTAGEIEALCEAMPDAIAQRQELIALLAQTNRDMAEIMKKTSAAK